MVIEVLYGNVWLRCCIEVLWRYCVVMWCGGIVGGIVCVWSVEWWCVV